MRRLWRKRTARIPNEAERLVTGLDAATAADVTAVAAIRIVRDPITGNSVFEIVNADGKRTVTTEDQVARLLNERDPGGDEEQWYFENGFKPEAP